MLQSYAIAGRLRGASARSRTRHVLIGVEVALAAVLLCGAGLLLKSLVRLGHADLGFLRGRVLVVRAPRIGERPTPLYYEDLRRRVEAIPGVEAVTFASFHPMTNSRPERRLTLDGGAESAASYCVVARDFFQVYGVHLLAGRGFTTADTAGAAPVVVINDALARTAFAGQSPLGAHIQLAGDSAPSEIVGVVGEIRQSLRGPRAPAIYRVAAQDPGATLQMGIRTYVEPLGLAAAVRREIGAAGGAAAELTTLDQFVLGDSWNTQTAGAAVIVFSVLALAIAAFGIFSVVSFVTGQRTREIGIRMALGARAVDIGAMLVAGGLRPVAVGLVVGSGAAFGLRRVLQGLLFDVQPNDPVSYGAAAAVLLAAALFALAIPARRAMRANPGDALRQL
jgi:putative ABC transport system permease protein